MRPHGQERDGAADRFGRCRGYVLTIGMHRSGTSAVAGALGSLGCSLPRPDDRVVWRTSNPQHYESLAVSLHDEGLLGALGGAWDAPPELGPHWIHTAAVAAAGASPAVLRDAFPDRRPAAWKDPRLCLLLPYWRRILGDPLRAVFVWRQPEAVARSLHARDHLPLADGLALWERYNRAALGGLAGLPVLVAEYDTMVDDPAGFSGAAARFLGLADSDGVAGGQDTPLNAGLRHQQHSSSPDQVAATPEQRRLRSCLDELGGAHAAFPSVRLPDETPANGPLFAIRRRAARQRRRRAAYDQMALELDATRGALVRLHRSTSWRVTRPLRWASRRLSGQHAEEPRTGR